jgi:hypothetical protein
MGWNCHQLPTFMSIFGKFGLERVCPPSATLFLELVTHTPGLAFCSLDRLDIWKKYTNIDRYRDGAMMETVVPSIRRGGVNTAYVMPNLVPPLTSVTDALAYRDRLQKQDQTGKINFLMTLYLHEKITPDHVRLAKAQGIVGIKSYPAGVTT